MFTISRGFLAVAVAATWIWTTRLSADDFLATGCNSVSSDRSSSTAVDTPPAKTALTPPEVRPQVDPNHLDLAQILRQWKQATTGVVRLDCRFARHKYDHVFEVEYRSEGTLAVDRDGRGAYSIEPVIVQRDAASRRRNNDGRPYAVKAESAERWFWTGAATIRMHDASRSFERISFTNEPISHSDRPQPPSLPEDPMAGNSSGMITRTNFARWFSSVLAFMISPAIPNLSGWQNTFREFWIPRSFLLGPRADELERKFHVELVKATPTQVWLSFRPRGPEKSHPFYEAIIILNRSEWTPYALKMIDPSRNSETVHIFSDLRINRTDPHATDLANPNLSGYQRR